MYTQKPGEQEEKMLSTAAHQNKLHPLPKKG